MDGRELVKSRWVTGLLCICLWQAFACGLVLHPNGEPDQTWTDRPDPNSVGRWGSNASCVPVAANYVVTTRHQGGGLTTIVRVGGVAYSIESIVNHPTADLRVVKLRNADIEYVDIYELSNESGKVAVIGGYGDGRGGLLQTSSVTYGYSWNNSSNITQRWGTNLIESTDTTPTGGTYVTEVIVGAFDDPGDTTYECAVAEHDSGGGWFIKSGGKWKLAGLSRGVEHVEESWFRNDSNPSVFDPDHIDAVRISSYAGWIQDQIVTGCASFAQEDINKDCTVDFADIMEIATRWVSQNCGITNNDCEDADVDGDGNVDLYDLAIVSNAVN